MMSWFAILQFDFFMCGYTDRTVCVYYVMLDLVLDLYAHFTVQYSLNHFYILQYAPIHQKSRTTRFSNRRTTIQSLNSNIRETNMVKIYSRKLFTTL